MTRCNILHNDTQMHFFFLLRVKRFAIFLSRATALWLLISAISISHAHAANSYFDMDESFTADNGSFKKWNTMRTRYSLQQKAPDESCGHEKFFPCSVLDWRKQMSVLRSKAAVIQLSSVNDYANAFPYVADETNWSVGDYWETPYEFHAVGGDCEDFAITKYYSLRMMGVPAKQLRVIIVEDYNLGGIIHAVLGIYEGKQLMILDNQIKQVIPALRIYHYKPIYGINEEGWWAYYPKRQ